MSKYDHVMVCMPFDPPGMPMMLPDNALGRCDDCRRPIQFRPGNDQHMAGLPGRSAMLCVPCATLLAEQEDVTPFTSKQRPPMTKH